MIFLHNNYNFNNINLNERNTYINYKVKKVITRVIALLLLLLFHFLNDWIKSSRVFPFV